MRVLAQAKAETAMTLKRGETLLVTIVIPAALLAFFSTVDVLPAVNPSGSAGLLPAAASVAIAATAMVGLGIATGFERHYRVLKRLGATPLTRQELVAAKGLSVLVVEIIQLFVLGAAAALLGWDGSINAGIAALAVVLGTAAFAGVGLTLAGRLRGEVNLAVNNAIFVAMLLIGGTFVPLSSLPGPLAAIGAVLPSHALTSAFEAATVDAGFPAGDMAVLAAWALGATAAAALTFRWE